LRSLFRLSERALHTVIGAWMAYILLAAVLLHPLVTRLSSHILADDVFIEPGRSDAYNFLWTYWWIQKAVLAGTNFYQCDWVFPPTGANLYFHTHVVLPTLLTLPVGMLLGPVAGYNSMIILMLSGAACVYRCFLRQTFGLRALPAFIAGAMFGFSPYFVFKTHAHVNLVGAAFWGGCIGLLVRAYVRDRFGWRPGLPFALCLWATFWTSFVEFFALLVVISVIVIAFEIHRLFSNANHRLRGRLLFFLMALPGLISLASLVNAPDASTVDVAPFPNLQFADLLIAPRLSFWGDVYTASEFEYWGSHLPIVFGVLALVGVIAARSREPLRGSLVPLLAIAIAMALLTLNPREIPIAWIRRLPMGQGFRVAGRFLPFFYFFLLIPAAYGAEALLKLRGRWARSSALLALALVAFAELFPWRLSPSAIAILEPTKDVVADGEDGVFTLIIPRGDYTNRLDTYQVNMDVPIVHLSYLARENAQTAATRSNRFPALYSNPRELSRRLLDEMEDARVHYVLFEDRLLYETSRFRGQVVAANAGAVLVRYYPAVTANLSGAKRRWFLDERFEK
jgi:hypothetical protein